MLALLLRLALDARLASLIVGGPWLLSVCERESRCELVDVHDVDAWASRRAWTAAVRAGDLDPQRCPWHRWDASPGAWSTRGPHGLMAAYTLRHLPCAPPAVLAVPLVSAWAARVRASSAACQRARRCRSWAS